MDNLDYTTTLIIKDYDINWDHHTKIDIKFSLKDHFDYKTISFFDWIKSFVNIFKAKKIKNDLIEVLIEQPDQPPKTKTLIPSDTLIVTHHYFADIDFKLPDEKADLNCQKSHFPLNIYYNGKTYLIKEDDQNKLYFDNSY